MKKPRPKNKCRPFCFCLVSDSFYVLLSPRVPCLNFKLKKSLSGRSGQPRRVRPSERRDGTTHPHDYYRVHIPARSLESPCPRSSGAPADSKSVEQRSNGDGLDLFPRDVSSCCPCDATFSGWDDNSDAIATDFIRGVDGAGRLP